MTAGAHPGESPLHTSRGVLNEKLARIARSLMRVGPTVNDVGRETGEHVESVRYRYRTYFVEKGFAIQAIPNYAKLGFKRLVLIAKFAPEFEPHATSILSAMSELCYLHSFSRALLEPTWIIHVAVPAELMDRCAALYDRMREMGLFAELEALKLEEMRNVPMKPEYYDFTTGDWSFDYPKPGVTHVNTVPSAKAAEVERYDKTDLLLLKELDIDATRTLMEISKKLKISYKTLSFHYLRHVKNRGLINGYRILWQGTRYDFKLERAMSKKHYYAAAHVVLTGPTVGERAELTSLLNSTPFLCGEASDPDYAADVFVPAVSYIDFLGYLGEFATRVGPKMRIFLIDQTKGLRFTICYKLYDAETKKWQLDSQDVITRFENLIISVRDGAT